jgi:hypothetical protein
MLQCVTFSSHILAKPHHSPACISPLLPQSHEPTDHYRLATENHTALHNSYNQIITESLMSPVKNQVIFSRWRDVLLSKYKCFIITWQQAMSVFSHASRSALRSTSSPIKRVNGKFLHGGKVAAEWRWTILTSGEVLLACSSTFTPRYPSVPRVDPSAGLDRFGSFASHQDSILRTVQTLASRCIY